MSGVMLSWPRMLVHAALTLVGALGAFQAATLRNGLDGVAWPVGLRHRRWGYFVAVVLLLMAFFGEAALVPLDVELPPVLWVLTLLVGVGVALMVSVVGAALRLRWARRQRQRPARSGSPVELGPLRATLYQPTTAEAGPFPAVCLLPDPTAPGDDLSPLTQALVEDGMAVLALEWRSLDHPDRLTLQGLVSLGISHLAERAEIDAERLGIAGVGLGGDLALRSAAIDSGVTTVLAIEPVLSSRRPMLGLDALRSLSWFAAQRRVYRWRHSPLVKELDALATVSGVASRPVAVVVASAGGPNSAGALEILRVAGGYPLAPAAHKETVQRTVRWLREQLT
jgi:hypothetical protein